MNAIPVRRFAVPWMVLCALLGLGIAASADEPQGHPLVAISGADGEFDRITIGEESVQRSRKIETGFARFQYFQLPNEARERVGPAYVEVTYQDVGIGRFDLEYDSAIPGRPYQRAERDFGAFLGDRKLRRTAVFLLSRPGFQQRQNLRADLRICSPSADVQLNIQSVVLYDKPPPRFLQAEAKPWIQPYQGRTRNDVDATTLHHKIMCGYQGWFRCPGDPADQGWRHWGGDQGKLDQSTVTVEMWPDLTEWSALETYPAGHFRNPDGSPAVLFSSADEPTVARHFDWMERYGIHGVFAQRFLVNLGDRSFDRVLGLVRDNANRTGRTFGVCYDMSGMDSARIESRLQADWKQLVDEWKLTQDQRYLHHGGKPVVFVWGFYPDRFPATTAHRILDIFQKGGPYEATVIGGCPWNWRSETNPEWAAAFRRFDVISPWNVGNVTRVDGRKEATTSTWQGDLADTKQRGKEFLPVIYPGFGWRNLKGQSAHGADIPRQQGAFYWRQFVKAADLGVDMAYVAMFDEVDEGTAIFKVTNTPPTPGHFQTFEGLRTDWYLRLTGEAAKLLRGERGPAMPPANGP